MNPRRNFNAHAAEYDAHARVQRICAERLFTRLSQFIGAAPVEHIVELGCGTGFLTTALALGYPEARLLAVDIAPAMVARTREVLNRLGAVDERHEARVSDARNLQSRADLIVSNLCLQWFDDPIDGIRRHAQAASFFACAILIDGTFAEWIEAHHVLGLQAGVREFVSLDALAKAGEALTPTRMTLTVETIEDRFDDGLAFVRDLRALGATTSTPEHRPVPLRRVLRRFGDGFVARYRIAFVLIERGT